MMGARRRAGLLIAGVYHALYRAVCGRHPRLRPWHFQWLAGRILNRTLPSRLALLEGDILDVGCGDQTYRDWVSGARRYVGLDIASGPRVDVVIVPGRPWPLADGEFDGVVCTQVIEHVDLVGQILDEIARTLRPGGRLVLSVPFIYNEHGGEHDFRRLSRHGVRTLLDREFIVEEVVLQGAVGSTLGVLFLTWVEISMTRTGAATLALTMLLPAWVALCAVVNVIGWLLDHVDRTGCFYGNVLVIARRRDRALPEG